MCFNSIVLLFLWLFIKVVLWGNHATRNPLVHGPFHIFAKYSSLDSCKVHSIIHNPCWFMKPLPTLIIEGTILWNFFYMYIDMIYLGATVIMLFCFVLCLCLCVQGCGCGVCVCFNIYFPVFGPGGWREKYKVSSPGPCSYTATSCNEYCIKNWLWKNRAYSSEGKII